MLFNSIQFVLFFPIVTVVYFLLPNRFRWAWLLSASCLFYMAFVPAYILILGFTIVIDYVAGLFIESAEGRRRKIYLAASIVSNVGVLAFFKYTNFLIDNVNAVVGVAGSHASLPLLRIVLPIGLSFHTFQAMAYTIEVYRGHQKAERHFGIYALYVMFYPQLVAGPIERPQNILPQLKQEHQLDYNGTAAGLKRMAWGFFQKVVVADRLALIANPVFNDPGHHHGLVSIVAAFAFTFQIYLDFAGYSNIAIGAAQVMGIRLMTNFRRPFEARSIAEFWTRWHISLSSWFRDYLYIPLGGNRVSKARQYMNLTIVFLVSGLWHGANWTFVVWGALHCFYLIVALLITPRLPARFRESKSTLVGAWNVLSVFTLVCLAFVFFRAATIADAWTMIRRMPVGLVDDVRLLAHRDLVTLLHGKGLPVRRDWLIAGVGLAIVQTVEWLERTGGVSVRLARLPGWLRWQVYAGLVYSIVLFANTARVQFIYFQF